MKRRLSPLTAFVLLAFALSVAAPALALDEPDRLWLVGERAFADGLTALARRVLERFVADHPADRRLPDAVLLLGKARIALGDDEAALEAFRRAQTFDPIPGRRLEAKFWEAEALFRLKRFADARPGYDEVLRVDAASPFAPDALYGRAWCDLELGQTEDAVASLSEFIKTWPDHAQAGPATFHLARALVELRRWGEAPPHLTTFLTRFPDSKFATEARYLRGWARVVNGEPRGAIADLRAFLAAAPTHDLAPEARRLLAPTLAKYGDRDELLEAYKMLMEETPATAQALYDAGTIAQRLGRARDQDAAWRKLRNDFPDHALAHRVSLELATAAFKRQAWRDAAALAEAAARSEDDAVRSEALLLGGESELKLKRFPAAAKAFEAVGDVAKVEASVRYRALAGLGLAREQQREWSDALAAYESVASRSPDPTLREWAEERVKAVRARIPKPAPPARKAPAGRPAQKTPADKSTSKKPPAERNADGQGASGS